MIDLSKYTNKDDLFWFLKENKDKLIAQKKFEMKRADAFPLRVPVLDGSVGKSIEPPEVLLLKDKIKVLSVINTTNLLDSHSDVHIKGLWKKSLKEQKLLYLLQEHRMTFDHIISDEVKASTKTMEWKELGFYFDGSTEALIFESEVEKSRNPYMFEQYARGYIRNHSVGMRYVQLYLCVDSDNKRDIEEKENWEKYIGEVANREEVDTQGYFWAVTEAKLVEGSAVPLGSNWATPTQSVKEFEFVEPSQDTRKDTEPPEGTQKECMFSKFINLKV